MQVEEEEEEVNVDSDDRDTYTIEDEFVGRRQAGTRGGRGKAAAGTTGTSRKRKVAKGGAPMVGQGKHLWRWV